MPSDTVGVFATRCMVCDSVVHEPWCPEPLDVEATARAAEEARDTLETVRRHDEHGLARVVRIMGEVLGRKS